MSNAKWEMPNEKWQMRIGKKWDILNEKLQMKNKEWKKRNEKGEKWELEKNGK